VCREGSVAVLVREYHMNVTGRKLWLPEFAPALQQEWEIIKQASHPSAHLPLSAPTSGIGIYIHVHTYISV